MTATERINERHECVIKECMSYHISVDEDGTFNLKKILHLDDENMNDEDGEDIEGGEKDVDSYSTPEIVLTM